MSEEGLVLPDPLRQLEVQILDFSSNGEELLAALKRLQRLGLSKEDLQVHIERIRAANDAIAGDDSIEEAAVFALDILEGNLPFYRLGWTQRDLAPIYLRLCLTKQVVQSAVEYAFRPSSLLPHRPQNRALATNELEFIAQRTFIKLESFELIPSAAETFRIPKTGFTTRPVALLAPYDRVILEALACLIIDPLKKALPREVIWPRCRKISSSHADFVRAPLEWDCRYVVQADIESFFECVQHPRLGSVTGALLTNGSNFARALEYFLGSLMSSNTGLPQGPEGSHILASAYLLPIDRDLSSEGWTFVRFADDFKFGATSIADVRRKIERLESILAPLGLRLNAKKTIVSRRATYEKFLRRQSRGIEKLIAFSKYTLRNEDPIQVERFLKAVETSNLLSLLRSYEPLGPINSRLLDKVIPDFVKTNREELLGWSKQLSKGAHPDHWGKTELDLRWCLIVLTQAKELVDLNSVRYLLHWFPRLAPEVSQYLASLPDHLSSNHRQFLVDWISSTEHLSDWVTAWIVESVTEKVGIIDETLGSLLSSVVRGKLYSTLTRVSGARVLAAVGQLSLVDRNILISDSSDAVKAELMLDSNLARNTLELD